MVPISEKMAPFEEEGTIRRMEGSILKRWSLSPDEGFYPQKKGPAFKRRSFPLEEVPCREEWVYPQMRGFITRRKVPSS